MRIRLGALLALCFVILFGCGNKVDDEALAQISEGLESRWAYADNGDVNITTDTLVEATQKELDVLRDYKMDDFKDLNLYVLYDNYRRELALIQTLIKDRDVDSESVRENWIEHTEKRAKTLYDLNSDYKLNISNKNKEAFEDVLASADRLVKIDDMKKVLSEIKSLTDLEVEIEENSIAVTYDIESALSNKSFVASKTGFPSQTMDILKILNDYDYDDNVIVTTNNGVIAASAYFDKNALSKVDFDKWDKLDSVDAHKFYDMAKAYHIRLGIWEELDAETQKLIGDMNKRDSNTFWDDRGLVYQ